MNMKIAAIALGTIFAATLSGCAATKGAEFSIADGSSKADSLLKKKESTAGVLSNVELNKGLYLGDQEIKLAPKSLPAIFYQKFQMTSAKGSITQIADKMALMTGFDFTVEGLDISATSGNNSSSTNSAAQSIGQQASSSTSSQSKDASVIYMSPYEGTLKGYLDSVASKANCSWRFDEGRVKFFTVETIAYQIDTLPGTIGSTFSVGATGGGSSSSSSSSSSSASTTNNSTATSTIDPWTSLIASVRAALTSRGKAEQSPASNTLLVTDTPEVQKRVAKLVKDFNMNLSKRVDLYVKVYSVQLAKGDSYGINWNTVYTWLANKSTIKLTTATSSSSTSTNSLSFTAAGSGPWSGSEAVMKALSTQGDVSEVTSVHVSPMSNRTAPVFVGNQISYISSSQTTTSTSTSSTSFTQSTLNTGFTLTLTPTIFGKNRVGLRYGMDLADLVSLTQVSSSDGSAIVQNPNLAHRSMFEDTVVHNGETLVIAGFDQNHNDSTRQGVGAPTFWGAGGSLTADKNRNQIVVVISSYIH